MDLNTKFSGFKNAERPSVGLALVFDVSGFTNFFNKPDIHFYITHYVNQIIDCVETIIWGGSDFWTEDEPEELMPLALKPIMRKFLGDGMLYVWEDNEDRILSAPDFKMQLINRLWLFQRFLWKINKELHNHIPVGNLPKSVKFGIAQGSIFKLTENDGSIDCIGPCINLASRLVKYCSGLNFIASARLNINDERLKSSNYFKVIAKELRSFENDIVIVDENDFNELDAEERGRLFELL